MSVSHPRPNKARPTPDSVSHGFSRASRQLSLKLPHPGAQLLVLSLQPRLLLPCELAASEVPWEAAPGQVPESPFRIAHCKTHCLHVPQPGSSVRAVWLVHAAHRTSRRQKLLYLPASQGPPSCDLI